MIVNGDPNYIVPRLKQEISKGISTERELGFPLTRQSIIEASENEDFQPTAQVYEVFPHFNSYGMYADSLK